MFTETSNTIVDNLFEKKNVFLKPIHWLNIRNEARTL